MIILSQDKKHLINFDNLTQIYITQDEEETEYEVRCETVGCLYETLGIYKTEGRAKEVLSEIMENYKNWEYTKMGRLIIGKVVCDAIYTMPEN